MADDSDLERNLPATPRRLEQARAEGQVARSRELAACATVAAATAVIWWGGPSVLNACARLLERGLVLRGPDALADGAMKVRFASLLLDGVLLLAPLLGAVAVAAVGASVLVGGWTFAPQAFAPDPARLSPGRGLGQIFSRHGAGELGKAVLKALVIALAAGGFLWTSRDALAALGALDTRDALTTLGLLVQHALVWFVGALVLIAAADVPLVLWRHASQLRMSLEEYKREMRESEGDPQLKARIRSLQRERARKRMMAEVPKADVVVTNPTHYAVALAYREDAMGAPRVVAKGRELMAAKIRALATEHAVPTLEAPPLARALYFAAEVGDDIPPGLYNAVAQVLAWVYQVRRAAAERSAAPAPPTALDVPPNLDRGASDA